MRSLSPPRVPIVLLALAAAVSIVLGVPSGAGSRPAHTAAHPNLLLGVTNDNERFQSQTGQVSSVDQAFVGWGQGQTYGAPFAQLFDLLGPVPMLHLGTGGGPRNPHEVITPQAIAQGKGDSYLVALNHAIASWGKGIYIRPMGEMNNPGAFYSGYDANGAPKDAAHAPAEYRAAFARIYVILHGGKIDLVNLKLKRLGLPPVQGEDPLPNLFPQLRVVWSPLAGSSVRVAGNAASNYYPGNSYVDIAGGDIYAENGVAPFDGLEALYTFARQHGKPFSVPEAGITDNDDPAFVNRLCTFVNTRPATELFAYYESKPGSRWDMGNKPQSRAAYRQCMVPLAGTLPAWAAANAPGGGASVVSLTLSANPTAGPAPLATTFSIDAKLTVPIQQWLLVFGDGTETPPAAGAPPATVKHTYPTAGVYPATLIVFPFPPYTTANARFYTSTDVTVGAAPVGAAPNPVLSIAPTPEAGAPPLAVSLRIEEAITGPISSWELIFGDGKTNGGTGAPPHFAGHTFTDAGAYNILLVVNQANGRRFMALATVAAIAPPTATKTGTVLVNGRPFTGGLIPFNAVVDVTNGTVTLVASVGRLKVYTQKKILARFKLVPGVDKRKPIIQLQLVSGNFSVCPKRKTASVGSSLAKPRTRVVREIWGDGKGQFRTKGRYASATVRGTNWLTADRCDGTFVQVRRGVVEVFDIKKNRIVRRPAGRTYLATGTP